MSTLSSFAIGATFAAAIAAAPAFATPVASTSGSGTLQAPILDTFDAVDSINTGIFVVGDDDQAFTFTANADTKVFGLKVNGIGLFDNLDLFEITFSSNFGLGPVTVEYDLTGTPGSTAVGEYLFDANFGDFAVTTGDSFTLEFVTTSAQVDPSTLVGVTFLTAVPVPAALPLMLTALGGVFALRRRAAA